MQRHNSPWELTQQAAQLRVFTCWITSKPMRNERYQPQKNISYPISTFAVGSFAGWYHPIRSRPDIWVSATVSKDVVYSLSFAYLIRGSRWRFTEIYVFNDL